MEKTSSERNVTLAAQALVEASAQLSDAALVVLGERLEQARALSRRQAQAPDSPRKRDAVGFAVFYQALSNLVVLEAARRHEERAGATKN